MTSTAFNRNTTSHLVSHVVSLGIANTHVPALAGQEEAVHT